jgi:hypothetical protein
MNSGVDEVDDIDAADKPGKELSRAEDDADE